jgi:hypothetical protein
VTKIIGVMSEWSLMYTFLLVGGGVYRMNLGAGALPDDKVK